MCKSVEYYSALKEKKILSFVTMWTNLEGITLSEIYQSQKDKCCMIPVTWGNKAHRSTWKPALPSPGRPILYVMNVFVPFYVCVVSSVLISEWDGPFPLLSLIKHKHWPSPNIHSKSAFPLGVRHFMSPMKEFLAASYKSHVYYPMFSLLDIFPREMQQVPKHSFKNVPNSLKLVMQITWASQVAQQWSACLQCGRPGFNPWDASPAEGNDNPLQYSCLGNHMDRGAWWNTVHGATKSQTWLSD